MRPARRSLALVLSLLLVVPPAVVSIPATAFAQAKKPIREQLPPEARGHWDAAIELSRRKLWDQARASFKAAYDASKNPRVLYNVAIAEKEMKQLGAAYETFKKMDAEGKGQLPPDEAADVKVAMAGLRQLVVELTIDVNERDAEIFIVENDGKTEEKLDTSRLPGPYYTTGGKKRVRATKTGFAEAVEVIDFGGGTTGKVSIRLQTLTRTARVNVNVVGPANAIVKVDGREVGAAPWQGQVGVSAEPHQFSAEAPGHVTATQSAIVKEGETLNLTLQLAVEQEKGKLLVLAKPEGATIEIDGKVAGATRWEGPVDARVHQVVVKKQGFYTWTYDVDVPRGGERSVTASLNEDRNTSFVPWLIGSIVVGAALIGAVVLIATPNDEEPQKGTLAPFAFGTQSYQPGFRF
jgi:hypothetical protein